MCTVTFIPGKGKVMITSNRDEKLSRKPALGPTLYMYKGWKMLYPKDAEANGTWIALKENGDVAVLLNGAFLKHHAHPPYRESRGVIFLDMLASKYPSYTFSKMDLRGIEPFTIILFERGSLYQFKWDGSEKFCKQLPASRPHIWSSVTLYDGLVIRKREQWFAAFLNRNHFPTQQDILNFHQFGGDGDRNHDLLMDRGGIYSTVSITSILLTDGRGSMKYMDMKNDRRAERNIELINEIKIL
jgi:hypothetical protein